MNATDGIQLQAEGCYFMTGVWSSSRPQQCEHSSIKMVVEQAGTQCSDRCGLWRGRLSIWIRGTRRIPWAIWNVVRYLLRPYGRGAGQPVMNDRHGRDRRTDCTALHHSGSTSPVEPVIIRQAGLVGARVSRHSSGDVSLVYSRLVAGTSWKRGRGSGAVLPGVHLRAMAFSQLSHDYFRDLDPAGGAR